MMLLRGLPSLDGKRKPFETKKRKNSLPSLAQTDLKAFNQGIESVYIDLLILCQIIKR